MKGCTKERLRRGSAEGRLLIYWRSACGTSQLYPRSLTLHTFSVIHRTVTPEFVSDVAYGGAFVELNEWCG